MKRNFILLGHAQSGKTTLAESILYVCGQTSRKGTVAEGNTVSDYNSDEITRQHSISSSLLFCNYKDCRIQMIDCPGYLDFFGEALAAIRAVDAAVIVVDALNSVDVGTEKAWDLAEEAKVPRVFFINKIDKPEADRQKALKDIQGHFSKSAVDISNLNSDSLIEAVAECDDKLLEKYLEQGRLSEEEIKQGMRKAVLEAKLFPVFYGSAQQDQAVEELLEAVVLYFPNPLERPAVKALDPVTQSEKELLPSEKEPIAGFVFKSIVDPYVGQLTLARIFQGRLDANTAFYNITKGVKERIGPLYLLQGKEQKAIDSASCGDIIAMAKLKETATSDTIGDEKKPVLFNRLQAPEAAISASIKPKSKADEDKISIALHKLTAEDPTFRVFRDNQTKETVVAGMGDLHLSIMVERLRKRFNVEVDLFTPKVAYKETIKKSAKVQGKYKRQSGGRGQYGDCWIEIGPLPHGGGFEFVDKVVGGAIPRNFIPSVEKGVRGACSEGALAGFPIADIRVTLYDGSYHDVDSSDMAFQIAGAMALRKAVLEASPVLLEPIMELEVAVPEEYMGQISGDLNSRRGRVIGMDSRGRFQLVKANVPQAEMFKYANDLRSMTQGRASFTMKFSHYEEVPAKIAQAVVSASGFKKKEEE